MNSFYQDRNQKISPCWSFVKFNLFVPDLYIGQMASKIGQKAGTSHFSLASNSLTPRTLRKTNFSHECPNQKISTCRGVFNINIVGCVLCIEDPISKICQEVKVIMTSFKFQTSFYAKTIFDFLLFRFERTDMSSSKVVKCMFVRFCSFHWKTIRWT